MMLELPRCWSLVNQLATLTRLVTSQGVVPVGRQPVVVRVDAAVGASPVPLTLVGQDVAVAGCGDVRLRCLVLGIGAEHGDVDLVNLHLTYLVGVRLVQGVAVNDL